MIEAVKSEEDTFAVKFAALQRKRGSRQPAWLARIRKKAFLRFSELGFPTTRDEAWRFTNIAPITRTQFASSAVDSAELSLEQVNELQFADLDCPRMVFVDGRYVSALSNPPVQSGGTVVASLAQVLQEQPQRLEPHLTRTVDFETNAFNALNTAFIEDGVFIEVPRGQIVDETIHLLFIQTRREQAFTIHPRILIVAGEGSEIRVVESHLGLGRGVYLNNPVTEIVAMNNSVVDHYKLQRESPEAFHVATVQLYQKRDASARTNTITLCGGLIRNETNTLLDGEGGWGELNGLFLVNEDHLVDNFTRLEHARPHCDSREVYKGILEDSARGVFRGRIVVDKGAQKTDSKQTNQNLLLSDRALVNTKPQLEIYADDVKCTHGATIGQLHEDAIFYLRSRGIDQKAARSILIYAFASEMVEKIKVDSLRRQLDSYLFEWLPRGELVKEAV